MTIKSSKNFRAEQQFFADPAIDSLMGSLMALATEHYVLRNRYDALEQELARAGVLDIESLNKEPGEAELASSRADANEFVAALLSPCLGLQQASGASGVFSLKKG
jgi:hypothetical protein